MKYVVVALSKLLITLLTGGLLSETVFRFDTGDEILSLLHSLRNSASQTIATTLSPLDVHDESSHHHDSIKFFLRLFRA